VVPLQVGACHSKLSDGPNRDSCAALKRLPVRLAAIAKIAQQAANELLADLISLFPQFLGDVALTSANPAQRCFEIAADSVPGQRFDGRQNSSWLPARLWRTALC
jgi:hypothetical protein